MAILVIGGARRFSLTRVFDTARAHRTLELCNLPVELVDGGPVSRLERFGVPLGAAALLALLLVLALS